MQFFSPLTVIVGHNGSGKTVSLPNFSLNSKGGDAPSQGSSAMEVIRTWVEIGLDAESRWRREFANGSGLYLEENCFRIVD